MLWPLNPSCMQYDFQTILDPDEMAQCIWYYIVKHHTIQATNLQD